MHQDLNKRTLQDSEVSELNNAKRTNVLKKYGQITWFVVRLVISFAMKPKGCLSFLRAMAIDNERPDTCNPVGVLIDLWF